MSPWNSSWMGIAAAKASLVSGSPLSRTHPERRTVVSLRREHAALDHIAKRVMANPDRERGNGRKDMLGHDVSAPVRMEVDEKKGGREALNEKRELATVTDEHVKG